MPFHEITGHAHPIAVLQAAVSHDRLGHAYLFHGEEAIGKRLTAVHLAQALNCEQPPSPDGLDSCGACRACLQIAARTHPDFITIDPDRELANPAIKIEQIREIEQQFVYRPLMGERKICLIDDADRMTIGAANARTILARVSRIPAQSISLSISGERRIFSTVSFCSQYCQK